MIILSRIVNRIIFSVLFMLLVISCSPPKQSSRNRYIHDNPGLTTEIKKAIRDGDIIPGMNKEHVLASWASPILKGFEIENDVSYETWIYPNMKNSPYVNLYFDNDVVVKVVKLESLPKYE